MHIFFKLGAIQFAQNKGVTGVDILNKETNREQNEFLYED